MTKHEFYAAVDRADAPIPTPLRSRSFRSVATDIAAGLFVAVAIGWLWVAKRR